MRVTWCLPRDWSGGGIGGYAIVYGYANRLSRRGHDVTVLHLDPAPEAAAVWAVKAWVRRLRSVPGAVFGPDDAVHRRSVRRLARKQLQGQDAVLATAWMTAAPVARLSLGARGHYFIQSYEHWSGPRDEVDATWHLPLTRIVIARWLVDVARELDALPVSHVPNAIDEALYRCVVPLEDRPAARVAMLGHERPMKRTADGLAALALAREALPDLTAVVFAATGPPADLPDWVEWHERATSQQVVDILNSASIFLATSELEGWALPPAEALSCGCALVSTDIGGVRDYAEEGVTALLARVGDVPALAAAVVRLARDPELRMSLGRAGSRLMQERFTWHAATDRLEAILAGAGDEHLVRS